MNTVLEHELQFRDGGAQGREWAIVIGLDFGTACTKAVVRVPDAPGGPSFAVPINGTQAGEEAYLLPSHVWLGCDGRLTLERPSSGALLYDLKLALLDNADSVPSTGSTRVTPREAAIGFLALVLRRVRQWFLTVKRKSFGSAELLWSCNVGLPTRSYEGAKACGYLGVVETAWLASVTQGEITLASLKDCSQRAGQFDFEMHPQGCELALLPEFAAEVAAYARSLSRQPGLHFLLDIGAGTLDLTAFIVHRQGTEDRLPILGAEVRRLGAHILHGRRILVMKRRSADGSATSTLSRLEERRSRHPGAPLPTRKELTELFPACAAALADVDSQFRSECLAVIAELVRVVRERRDPYSDRFDASGELPLFLCGGGARMPVFQELANDLDRRLRNTGMSPGGCRKRSMPPSNLDAGGMSIERLGVAWGLSLRADDVGRIVPSNDIEDIETSSRSQERRPCPCGGTNEYCDRCGGSKWLEPQSPRCARAAKEHSAISIGCAMPTDVNMPVDRGPAQATPRTTNKVRPRTTNASPQSAAGNGRKTLNEARFILLDACRDVMDAHLPLKGERLGLLLKTIRALKKDPRINQLSRKDLCDRVVKAPSPCEVAECLERAAITRNARSRDLLIEALGRWGRQARLIPRRV